MGEYHGRPNTMARKLPMVNQIKVNLLTLDPGKINLAYITLWFNINVH